MGDYTQYYGNDANYRMPQKHNTLVIVDRSGIRELDMSEYTDAVYTFGRSEDNSIQIHSEIVSGHHGEINISQGLFYLKDNNSSNGTYIAYGAQFFQVQPGQYYGGDGKDMIIRLGTSKSLAGCETVLMLYDCDATEGRWKTYQLHDGDNSIGRIEGCDIRLNNVAVSRLHAGVRQINGEFFLFDNKSANGVFVNGIRIDKPYKLCNKDIFTILNTTFIYDNGQLFYKVNAEGIALELRGLNKEVPAKGGKKTILDKVSLSIGANEFVAIIGGSGAGKTTLMTAMSGFDTDITGDVYCNGINLRENFQTLKNIIGFVPQQDIIYENITLKKMLYYTAKLKMPEDTSKDEIEKRIHDVLQMVELLEHQDTYIRRLSGGQKKRASIAVELLANPGLFFLDEPTSGLDPGTEEHLMHTLSRLSKEQEKTIIMVTHTTNNLHLCDKVIIMGYGGKLCYCGKPEGIKDFFHTEDIVRVYDMITENTGAWEQSFKQSGINRLGNVNDNTGGSEIKPRRVSSMNQLGVLTRRYLTLIKNDLERLAMIFIQPILIGILMAIVAEKGIFDKMFETRSILFALMSAGIWMGLFNTIQEIYKERVILKREYMANLKLPIYMLSKYIVQAMIAVVQSVLMVAVFVLIKGAPKCSGVVFGNAVVEMMMTIFVTILVSAGFGLLISACSKNGDRAMTIAPFVLIIQLLFSGILFALNGVTEKISYVTISRWSMEALGSTNDLNGLEPIGEEAKKEAEEEAKEKQEELIAECNDMIASMQDAYDETINDMQDAIEYYSIYANDPQSFEEYESQPVTIEAPEDDGTDTDDETEEDPMFVRKNSHVLMCWGLLLGATVLFAAGSTLILTKLKDEQR
ncbi:MAG: ATP-binding cassette domain-containing protein [Eubacteriales bacterium]|nr:ATP-binding cassette domain-containing protein [Lachnospiraceae bacterium]MDO5127876.1 ATP-binding cassette domain-containing protein [Eubacteriales bacterium]